MQVRYRITVTVERWENGWMAEVLGVGVTQASTFSGLERAVRDYLETVTGTEGLDWAGEKDWLDDRADITFVFGVVYKGDLR